MGAMNYPSTTQALFALIVMIIVLLFILVYCCWGTFTCARQDDAAAPSTEEGGGGTNTHQNVRQILHGPHTVIVPINNMIYVGDPETHQIYQIPLDRDKPPAYTEVFHAGPPPPYRLDTIASDSSSTATANREQGDTRTSLPENPPAYDECLSATTEEFGGEQNRDAASVPPEQQQQQQEHTSASDTTTPAVTESPPSTIDESVQEASRVPRPDLVLTVSTLPQESLQPAEEGPHNASAKPQRGH
ncbi:uncharacterized protein LOC123520167 isoform X2 [Portunus trituberculatus]|uniref:uncharacterized protein LOC123520167 isoform X2 n=1 Tax=Portunus trituberculatus TaxID=210409 RepID=UPI001E1D1E33|nr:uncharacterized protein LOC123520167 isoform X2 [Portunus trituberculatus]